MELRKGHKLQNGRYIIERFLGQGTFGITYLAYQTGLEKYVAIKEFFMNDLNRREANGGNVEGSGSSIFTNYRLKFKNEAKNLSKLSHSHIVRVIDVFDENNTTYYVMEYLDGSNLDDYIQSKGRIPEMEALAIVREIGGALSYMHSKKMLHLDIKPKNIMRSSNGTSYLIDFGLSKQYTEDGEPESSTSVGSGTPGYSPLEQSQYKQDGPFPATLDVYALGATLYKMLTGKRPPEASIILNNGFPYDDFDITSKNTMDVLSKSMSPAKKDRWSTIDEFLDHLPIIEDEKTILDKNLTVSENKTVTYKNERSNLTLKSLWESRPMSLNIASIICILFYGFIWLYCTYIFTGETVISSYGDIFEFKNLIRIILYILLPYIGLWGCISLIYGNKKLWYLPIILYLFYVPISFTTGASTHISLLFIIVLVAVYTMYYLIMRKELRNRNITEGLHNILSNFKKWPIISRITIFFLTLILLVLIIEIGLNYPIEYYRFSLSEALAIAFCTFIILTSKIIGLYLIIPILIIGYIANFHYFKSISNMYCWTVEEFATIGFILLLISMCIKVNGRNTYSYLY